MGEHYRTTVVEVTKTAGFGITSWRDTLNGKKIETASNNKWETLL